MRPPVSACVPVNHTVTLSVRAEGTGLLQYQWFTDDENVVYEVCGLSKHYCFHYRGSLCSEMFRFEQEPCTKTSTNEYVGIGGRCELNKYHTRKHIVAWQ